MEVFVAALTIFVLALFVGYWTDMYLLLFGNNSLTCHRYQYRVVLNTTS